MLRSRIKQAAKPIAPTVAISAVYEGIHPHLHNHVKLTLFVDGTVKIERGAYKSQSISRYDGRPIEYTKSFDTVIEPQKNHYWLIHYFKQNKP